MNSLTVLFIGIGLGVLGALVFMKDGKTEDDPTGDIKKEIGDKLDKIISDVKTTV